MYIVNAEPVRALICELASKIVEANLWVSPCLQRGLELLVIPKHPDLLNRLRNAHQTRAIPDERTSLRTIDSLVKMLEGKTKHQAHCAMSALCYVAYAWRPMTSDELLAALNTNLAEFEEPTSGEENVIQLKNVDELLHLCSNNLYVGGNGQIGFNEIQMLSFVQSATAV